MTIKIQVTAQPRKLKAKWHLDSGGSSVWSIVSDSVAVMPLGFTRVDYPNEAKPDYPICLEMAGGKFSQRFQLSTRAAQWAVDNPNCGCHVGGGWRFWFKDEGAVTFFLLRWAK